MAGALRVARVASDAERERLYAFRYKVYVEEFEMTRDADHGKRRLVDELDAYSDSYAVFRGEEVVGSLRVTMLADLPDPGPLIAKYAIEPAVREMGLGAIAATSRFILAPELRMGTTIFRLMQAAYRDGTARGTRLNYGDCSPHLLPFYEHLGFRRYTRGYNDTAFGYKIPILMLVGDREYFRRNRSPLRRLVEKAPDDAAARRWFERTYPGYLDTQSAVFLPDDVFFDVLSGRVASDPLHSLALLRGLDREEAARFLGAATLLEIGEGDLVIREGERDNTLYVLLSGVADVTVGDPGNPPVAVFGAGDTFGEIGFLTSVPRTANVVARADCEVLVLSGDFMERFIAREPAIGAKVLLNLSRELAGRLAVTTSRAAAAPER